MSTGLEVTLVCSALKLVSAFSYKSLHFMVITAELKYDSPTSVFIG